MRPIEFRAWATKEKRWINADKYTIWMDCEIIELVEESAYNDDYSIAFHKDRDEFELMQYTGLKDKNDNKIFEGDIVAPSGFVSEINKPGIVKWCEKKLCFYVDSIETSTYSAGYKMYFGYDSAIEIVGNIHENKELLEGCAEE